MSNIEIPTYETLMNPTIKALNELGGSATIEELDNKAIEIAGVSDEQLGVLHNPERGGTSEVEYRLAWTRTYLKKYGILENSSRGVWALTREGRQVENVDPKVVTQFYKDQKKKEKAEEIIEDEIEDELTWREDLIETLVEMDPSAFERLAQRLLRESGFIQVEVTGRTGDGGIDGKGIMRLGGMLSFHVLFQCKKYQGSVSASQVRDFRGAMVGRADKGLLITTGSFTRGAIQEATRDGATAIDLIDGDLLIDRLKELRLGVETKIVEEEHVTIDKDWFASL